MTASKYVKGIVYIFWYIYVCFPKVKSHLMIRAKENTNTKCPLDAHCHPSPLQKGSYIEFLKDCIYAEFLVSLKNLGRRTAEARKFTGQG